LLEYTFIHSYIHGLFFLIAVSDHASKCQPCQYTHTHTHTHTWYANNYTVRLLAGFHLFTDAVKTGECSTKFNASS
jgi:hypothetical protein